MLTRGCGQPLLQTCLDGEGAGGTVGGTVMARQAPCGTQVDGHPGDGRAAWGSPGYTASLSRAVSHGVWGPGAGLLCSLPRSECLAAPAFPRRRQTPTRKAHLDQDQRAGPSEHLLCEPSLPEGPESRHSGGLTIYKAGQDRGARAGPARRRGCAHRSPGQGEWRDPVLPLSLSPLTSCQIPHRPNPTRVGAPGTLEAVRWC